MQKDGSVLCVPVALEAGSLTSCWLCRGLKGFKSSVRKSSTVAPRQVQRNGRLDYRRL